MGKILARYVYETPMDRCLVPGKLFLHSVGVEAFYKGPGKLEDKDWQIETCVEEAGAYAKRILTRDCYFLLESVFTLGVIWGQDHHRHLNLFIYDGVDQGSSDSWRLSNPNVRVRQNCQGIWNNNSGSFVGGITCEDSLIILGREAINRRKTGSLDEYMKSHAYLMDMEPSEQYRSLKI